MLYTLYLFFLITVNPEIKYGWALDPPVVVRDEPSGEGNVVGWIEDDTTRIKILSTSRLGLWYFVELPNGKKGYVLKKKIIPMPKTQYFEHLKKELYSLVKPMGPETILIVNPLRLYRRLSYKHLECDSGIMIPSFTKIVLKGIYKDYYLTTWDTLRGFVHRYDIQSAENQALYVKTLRLNLRVQPSTEAPILEKLEINDKLRPIDLKGNWIKVKYGNKIGWVSLDFVSSKPIPQAQARRLKFVNSHNLPARHKKLILEGSICIGMTKDEVKASWGEPDDINRFIYEWGTKEQWIYGDTYLYFEGNKLTAIQEW